MRQDVSAGTISEASLPANPQERGTEVRVRSLRQGGEFQKEPARPPPHPPGPQTDPVQGMWQVLCFEDYTEIAHEDPYWGQTVRVQPVWQVLHAKVAAHGAHEVPHRGEAVRVQCVSQRIRQ